MPWAAYDARGRLLVGFFDRSYDAANHEYGYTLATETLAGSLQFGLSQVTTALSDPTKDTVGLGPGGTFDPDFPNPAFGIGDYSGIASGRGFVATYWTDLREQTCVNGQCGSKADAYFDRVPPR